MLLDTRYLMMSVSAWYFTPKQIENTPIAERQEAARLIQDLGQLLRLNQLCISTAIVYMHRFCVFHSIPQFSLGTTAAASLFLAAKVEEQPRRIKDIIYALWSKFNQKLLDVKSKQYLEMVDELLAYENVLLLTLGFDLAIEHPHPHVVRCCQLLKASKDLAHCAYSMASSSLLLTTMCLQYKPTVVACFCIHLAYKWSNWEIPQSNEVKNWFTLIDNEVTQDLLEKLTQEFHFIYEKLPPRFNKELQLKTASPQAPPSSSQHADSREHQEKCERLMAAPQGSHSQNRDGHHLTNGHLDGHPHPLSASALLVAHAGMPVHNTRPHPTQHPSSLPHHPQRHHPYHRVGFSAS